MFSLLKKKNQVKTVLLVLSVFVISDFGLEYSVDGYNNIDNYLSFT